jgi:hypothetical protein
MKLTDITTAQQARQLWIETDGRCEVHFGKVKIATAEEAAKAILKSQVNGRSEQRLYLCPEGHHYHLTSKTAHRETPESKLSVAVVRLANTLK